MHLPPSKIKLLLGRMNQWKSKVSDKSYQLREAKKENKRLKGCVSHVKETKNEMKMNFLKQIETLQTKLAKIQQADDEKIEQLESRVQQLECEAEQADVLKKTV